MSARSRPSSCAMSVPHVPDGVHFIPGHPVAGTEQSGPEAGFAELFDGRWCILTPPPGTEQAAVERLASFWRGCGSEVEIMEPEAPRSGAGDHQPRAASDRLQHRGHRGRSRDGDAERSDQILGERLSRFHPHRRLRSDDVARHLPEQPRGGARDAGALQRGPCRASARGALGRRRCAVQSLHAHARDPALDHPGGAGHGGAGFRPLYRREPPSPEIQARLDVAVAEIERDRNPRVCRIQFQLSAGERTHERAHERARIDAPVNRPPGGACRPRRASPSDRS